MSAPSTGPARVDLYWLPLGAGDNTHCVRTNGRVYEWCAAAGQHRERQDLYHSALEVRVDGDRHVIEMAPVWSSDADDRGVVREGPVGSRRIGRWRLFRYEVRRWRGGVIPDATEAVGGAVHVPTRPLRARTLLSLVPEVPAATWGRDELGTGEMWNSNSLVSWLLARSGHDTAALAPPGNGRAPGWAAGLVVARRSGQQDSTLRPARGGRGTERPRAAPVGALRPCRPGRTGANVELEERRRR